MSSAFSGQAGTTAVLLAATAAPALLTAGVSTVAPLLLSDLDLTRAEFGAFAVVLFSVTAVLSIPFGRAADRIDYRLGLPGVYVLVTAGVLVAATSQNMVGLLVAGALVGAALAAVGPITNRVVGILGAPARRGAILAAKQSGVQVAQATAAIMCPLIATAVTWRMGLASLVVPLLVMFTATLLWARPWTGSDARIDYAKRVTHLAEPPVRPTRPRLFVIVLSLYAILSGFTFQSVLLGLPLFAHDALGFDLKTAGYTLLVLGVAGFASRIGWGILTDRWGRTRGPLILTAVLSLVGIAALTGASVTGEVWMVWAGAAVFGASANAVTVLLAAAVLRHHELSSVGTISGVISVSTFASFAAGPLVFGVVADRLGYNGAWMMLFIVQALACLTPLLLRRRRVPSQSAPRATSRGASTLSLAP